MKSEPHSHGRTPLVAQCPLRRPPESGDAAGFAPRGNICRALWRDEQASNLIEVALALPLYLAMIFGMMTFAIVLFAYCNAIYASRVAVRYAVLHSSTATTPCTATLITSLVQPYLWGAPAGGVTITPSWVPANTVGSTFSIKITLGFNGVMPYTHLSGLQATTTSAAIILH